MNGLTAMKQLTDIDEHFIQNAYLPDELLDSTRKTAPEKPHRDPWYHSTGWLVAGICAVVGISVYVALIGLGRGWFGNPAAGPAVSETVGEPTESDTTEAPVSDPTEESTPDESIYSKGLSYAFVEGGCAVAGIGSCSDVDIVIPPTFGGRPVVAVEEEAFLEKEHIRSVVLPDSVTSIGQMAFSQCRGLTSVKLPENGNLQIGICAFSGCTSLTEIYLYDGTDASWGLFKGCTALTSVRLPADMTKLLDNMFYGCVSLTSVTLPDGLIAIGHAAFEGCTSLSSIVFPETLVSINDSAFASCPSLHTADIRIPQSVTYIGLGAFDIDGGTPGFMVTPEGDVFLEDGSPFGTYECYVDNCLIYVLTTDETYTVREGTRLIADGGLDMAMILNHDVKTIILPDSLEYLCGTWVTSYYTIIGEYTHLPVTSAW